MDLHDNGDWKTTFINEDLTTRRSKFLFKTRNYARAGLLKSSYSSDGRMYVNDKSDKKHLIVTDSDLIAFGTLPETSSNWCWQCECIVIFERMGTLLVVTSILSKSLLYCY